MFKNEKKNKRKKIIITICVILVFSFGIFYSLKLNRKMSIIEKGLKDIVIVLEKCVMYPWTILSNEKDTNQDDSYLIQKNVNTSLEKEIQELKDLLNLNKTLTEYNPINATILNRNKDYYFNTITIDKGSKDKVKEDMAVITKNGLIGKISKVTYNSSEVKLITSDDLNYKVSVSISLDGRDIYAILGGYDKNTSSLIVKDVSNDSNVKKGDVVLTSGLGGLFPRGIYVGVVDKIKTDKYNLSKTLYVKTNENFNSIHYVTILKENK